MTVAEAKNLAIGTSVKLTREYHPWEIGEIVNIGILHGFYFDMSNDPKAEGKSFVLPIDFIKTVAKKEIGLIGDIEEGTLLRVKRTFYPWKAGDIIEVLNFTPADMSNIDIKYKIEKHFTYGITRDSVIKVDTSMFSLGTTISSDNLPETGPSNDTITPETVASNGFSTDKDWKMKPTDYTKDYAERPKRPEDVFYRPKEYLIKDDESEKTAQFIYSGAHDSLSSFGLALLAKKEEEEKIINNKSNNNNNNHIKLKLFDVPKI